MKGKKTISIIILIIAILLIGSGIVIQVINPSKDEEKPKETEKVELPSGVDYDENIESWRTKASTDAMKVIDEIFPEDYQFELNDNKEYKVSLSQLQTQYQKDFSFLNTQSIKCNLDTSIFTVSYDSDIQSNIRSVTLDCIG